MKAALNKRYTVIDIWRGLAVLAMILYHTLWDLVYVYGVEVGNWGDRPVGRVIFQACIRWSFLLLSGFCFQMGRHQLKRGLTILGGGVIITLVTMVVMGDYAIHFGVLTFIGCAMVLMIPLHKLFKHVPGWLGFALSLVLFLMTEHLSVGYLGMDWCKYYLPFAWYANYFTAWVGLPSISFYSSDYVPMIPWLFVYFMGYFAYSSFKKWNWLKILSCVRCKPLEWVGRNALIIYMLHQPIVYGALYLIFQ